MEVFTPGKSALIGLAGGDLAKGVRPVVRSRVIMLRISRPPKSTKISL